MDESLLHCWCNLWHVNHNRCHWWEVLLSLVFPHPLGHVSCFYWSRVISKSRSRNTEDNSVTNQFWSHGVNQPINGFTRAWAYCFQGQLSRLTAFTNYREKANKISRDLSWLFISLGYLSTMQLQPEVLGAAKHNHTARSACSQLWCRQTWSESHAAALPFIGVLSSAVHCAGV